MPPPSVALHDRSFRGAVFSVKAQKSIPYDEKFFDSQFEGALRAARAVIPIVLDLSPAKTVVDFGCGRGTWLRACLETGVETVLGLDGHYVNQDTLLIDRDQFRAVDLGEPIRLEGGFDLALCLEVAEHLPARSARTLVQSLTDAASVILFSAAVPGQGGTSHVNEQWPLYWERLFAERGMRKYDVVRPLIWRDRSICPWYRQNIYIYTNNSNGAFDHLEHFEPEFTLVLEQVMGARRSVGAPVDSSTCRCSGGSILGSRGYRAFEHERERSMLSITVAICTWNRARLLDQTLTQMHNLRIPSCVEWELLVVNNSCSDDTDEVIGATNENCRSGGYSSRGRALATPAIPRLPLPAANS